MVKHTNTKHTNTKHTNTKQTNARQTNTKHTNTKKKEVVVVGAGLVGSLWALLLARRGHNVQVFERRADMRKQEMSAGKSINLALSDRGLKALDLAGAGAAVRQDAIPMHGRLIHDRGGKTNLQPYGEKGQFINSVSRGGLNCTLMTLAEEAGVDIVFDHACTAVTMGDDDTAPTATFTAGAEANRAGEGSPAGETLVTADVIFGCDGAFSAVRSSMLLTERFNYRIDWLEHGYKELIIPAAPDAGGQSGGDGSGTYAIEKNALHIWPRGDLMLIALPNPGGSFTCTLFLPFEGEHSFASLQTAADIESFFNKTFPDAQALMPTLAETFLGNPTGALGTVRCSPWQRNGKVCLLGDAAHAIVPFYGQGMIAGFEDCSVLSALLDDAQADEADDFSTAIEKFAVVRKPDADAIADLALYNFIEMRDRVADERFVLRKKIERKISDLYGDRYFPLYTMVTFSHLPYAKAKRYGDEQEALLSEILQIDEIDSRWDSAAFEPELRRRVDALLDNRE